jgi:hypothetical protein
MNQTTWHQNFMFSLEQEEDAGQYVPVIIGRITLIVNLQRRVMAILGAETLISLGSWQGSRTGNFQGQKPKRMVGPVYRRTRGTLR